MTTKISGCKSLLEEKTIAQLSTQYGAIKDESSLMQLPIDILGYIGNWIATGVFPAYESAKYSVCLGRTCSLMHLLSHRGAPGEIIHVIRLKLYEDDALLKIWSRISKRFSFSGYPPTTPAEIKKWLENKYNAEQINGIVDLTLSELELKAIPPHIEKFTQLKQLDLNNNQIANIDVLGKVTSLKWLSLCNNQITNIDALSRLTSLEYLSIHNNQITNIDALSKLIWLNLLSLSSNQIVNIDALSKLIFLENLYLNNNQIVNVEALGQLTLLKELSLNRNQIVNVDALGQLALLKELSLNRNQIINVDALTQLTSLKRISL